MKQIQVAAIYAVDVFAKQELRSYGSNSLFFDC